ncbi:MAG: metal-dependent transcriptional regulator [Firmicutes bacterium]|nr:metal-dependent transcriptional regulator [Bacillota bacterium]
MSAKASHDEGLVGAEAYLEAIYVLTTENREVLAARIAEYLGVSPVSVSRALTRLEKRGDLLQRTPEVRLTEQGWRRAEAVVRRHRLAERWLADRLGLNLVEAHREAERLEHALSDRVEEALWEDLGRPGTCPHGNPIPGLGLPSAQWEPLLTLDTAPPGLYVVERIFEQLEGLEEHLEWIEQAGLVPGATCRVTTPSDPSSGSCLIYHLDGTLLKVPASIASRLLVRQLVERDQPQNTVTTV